MERLLSVARRRASEHPGAAQLHLDVGGFRKLGMHECRRKDCDRRERIVYLFDWVLILHP